MSGGYPDMMVRFEIAAKGACLPDDILTQLKFLTVAQPLVHVWGLPGHDG